MTETLSLGRVATAAAFAIGCSVFGYAVYFDHKRRTDSSFRRQLKQQRMEAKTILDQFQVDRASKAKASVKVSGLEIDDSPPPATAEGREAYFEKQLTMGDAFISQGQPGFESAAVCYFKALKVYPDPMNFLRVLQQSLPEPVVAMIVDLMSADVQAMQSQKKSQVTMEEVE